MRFVYIGGETTSEHVSESYDARGQVIGVDERQGVKMPPSTTAFGVEFIVNQPVDVTREMFPNDGAFNHAIKKLKINRFFKLAAEEVPFDEVVSGGPSGGAMADSAAMPVAAERKGGWPKGKPRTKPADADPSELAEA